MDISHRSTKDRGSVRSKLSSASLSACPSTVSSHSTPQIEAGLQQRIWPAMTAPELLESWDPLRTLYLVPCLVWLDRGHGFGLSAMIIANALPAMIFASVLPAAFFAPPESSDSWDSSRHLFLVAHKRPPLALSLRHRQSVHRPGTSTSDG